MPYNIYSLTALLSQYKNVKIFEAYNGEEAIKILLQNYETEN